MTASLFAASDTVAIAVASKWPGTESVSTKLAGQLKDAFVREGLPVVPDAETRSKAKAAKLPDPRTCNGVRACVEKLSLALGEGVVIASIEVAKLADRLIVRVEVVRGDGTEPLDKLEVTTNMKAWAKDTNAPVNELAKRLKGSLQRKEPEPAQAQPQATLTPEPKPEARPA
ncbi:MAG: hypothetical protein JNK82_35620, partial [Myxococcaceae bacterium]|nr:hypothetical protein [Myxococcaceae bacterium]